MSGHWQGCRCLHWFPRHAMACGGMPWMPRKRRRKRRRIRQERMRRRRKKEEIITPCPLKGGSFPLLLLARARKRNKKARSLQGNARKNRKRPDAEQVRRREAASGRMIVNGVLQVSIMEDTKGGGVDIAGLYLRKAAPISENPQKGDGAHDAGRGEEDHTG